MSNVEGLSSPFQAVTNSFKAIMGSGIVAIPFAFKVAGIFPGLFIVCSLCIGTAITMWEVVRCVRITRLKEAAKALSGEESVGSPCLIGSPRAAASRLPVCAPDNLEAPLLPGATGPHEDAYALAPIIGFAEIGRDAFGWWGAYVADASLLVCQLLAGAIYLVFVAGLLSPILHLDFTMAIIAITVVETLLCLLRTPTFLTPVSSLGNTALFLALAFVMYHVGRTALAHWHGLLLPLATSSQFQSSASATNDSLVASLTGLEGSLTEALNEDVAPDGTSTGEMYAVPEGTGLPHLNLWTNLRGAAECFGICVFAFSAHGEIMSIEQSLGAAARSRFFGILMSIMSFAGGLACFFGLTCYAVFGEDTRSIIFNNLADKDLLATLVKVCISIVVAVNYPLAMFPVLEDADRTLLAFARRRPWLLRSIIQEVQDIPTAGSHPVHLLTLGRFGRSLARIPCILFTFTVAMLAGDQFGLLTAVGGGLGGFIAWVLPPLMYMKLEYGGRWRDMPFFQALLPNLVLVLVGVLGCLGSVYGGIQSLSGGGE
eukprot:jgi/Mesvir1/14513/Mv05211-RA.1